MDLPDVVRSVMTTDLAAYEVSERITAGDVHDVFAVTDKAGREYVLKVAGEDARDRRRIAHEAAVTGSLAMYGFVPAVVDSGVTDSRAFVLLERVDRAERPGDPSWESAAASTLGETLRTLHTEGEWREEWSEDARRHRSPENRIDAAIADTLSELRVEEYREYTRVLPDVTRVLRETTPRIGLVHGDLTIDNVLFGPDGESCVLVDWETAARFDAYFDVAKAELWLFRLFGPLFSTASADLVAAFRRAYGLPESAVERVQAHELLQACRMVPRVRRLGPYSSWTRRTDAPCLDHVESVLDRLIADCSFLVETP